MATAIEPTAASIADLLGADADDLLSHRCETIDRSLLHLPGGDFIDRVMVDSDRSTATLRSLRQLFNHGRLAGTGYVSILPVDQGIEHSAGASFAPNPIYFDPERIVELAVEGGCNAVASTLGVLGAVSRKWAHRIPFIVKLNHNELLTYPSLLTFMCTVGKLYYLPDTLIIDKLENNLGIIKKRVFSTLILRSLHTPVVFLYDLLTSFGHWYHRAILVVSVPDDRKRVTAARPMTAPS